MATNQQKDCPLFYLPAELRNLVYKYALSINTPPHRIVSRLPVESPVELIDLHDAANLRPTNELLISCRKVYREARDMFVAAQREFWANNAFLIQLKEDWEDISDEATRLPSRRLHWSDEHFNVIPRIVIYVRTRSWDFECHLLNCPHSKFEIDMDPYNIDTRMTYSMDELAAFHEERLKADEVARLVERVYQKAFSGKAVVKTFMCAAKYGRSANEYIRAHSPRQQEVSRTQMHMLRRLDGVLQRIRDQFQDTVKPLRQRLVLAVLTDMIARYGVQMRPTPWIGR